MELANRVKSIIYDCVRKSNTETKYREPLIGFAAAKDPLFLQLKEIIGDYYLQPVDLLPGAKTVIAFFLPFNKDIVAANRGSKVAREWALAYAETNNLISEICAKLKSELNGLGITTASEKATHNFNEKDLITPWSHKSTAYIAGLGTFGLHRMLITSAGCAGRFGSIVISAEIPPTDRPEGKYCRYYTEKKCMFCVKNCPTGALQIDGIDKFKCYKQLLEIDQQFSDLGLCDACGKCAVGPCALGER